MVTCAMRKKHKSEIMCSASADLIGGNEDLIDKILSCLPARSLIRFKSVSKQWNSLISDRRFGLNHTLINLSSRIPTGLFFYYRDIDNKYVTLHSVPLSKTGGKIPCCSHPFDKSVSNIVHSCNGLILFYENQQYYVCNIVTKQLQCVPFPKLYPRAGGNSAWFLAFDPSVSSHYKILCIQEVELLINKIMIFSSETGQWKDTDVKTDACVFLSMSAKGVYMQGAIYCLVTWNCYRFDVEAEKLTTISLPDQCSSSIRYFGEFNGHLHLVYVRDKYVKRFRVFELDHVTQKWVVKYHVQINHLISRFPEVVKKVSENECSYKFSILSVVRGEKEDNSALVMAIPGKVVSYNLKSKKFELNWLEFYKLTYVNQLNWLVHVSEKWFVKYEVHIDRLTFRFPEVVIRKATDNGSCRYAFSIISVMRGGKEEDSAVIMTIPGKVASYNFKSKKFELLCELPLEEDIINTIFEFNQHKLGTFVFPFIPTLYP